MVSARSEPTATSGAAGMARLWPPGRLVPNVEAATGGPLGHLTSLFERRSYDEGEFVHDSIRLHYESHGSGDRTVVLMHGLLLDTQLNRRLAADLAERGFRVVLLDLPGHGLSDKPRHASAHRMDSYARHVIALLDELGVDDAVIGGVSLGANVALQAAIQAPTRVRGLVIEMPVLEWAVPGAALVFLPLLLGVHYASPLVRIVSSLAKRLPKTRIAPLDSFLTTLTLQPEEAAAVLHGMLVGPITPTYEERHSIDAPALVIGHKVDFIHPFTDADHIARQMPNAELVQAHTLLELRVFPARLTERIATFLDTVWRPQRSRRAAPRRLRAAEQA
jgi:pimeloyl-ACP methyl ester carboxylesterase